MTYEEMLIRHAQQDAYEAYAKIADVMEINLINRLLKAGGISQTVDGCASEIAIAIRQAKEKLNDKNS